MKRVYAEWKRPLFRYDQVDARSWTECLLVVVRYRGRDQAVVYRSELTVPLRLVEEPKVWPTTK